MYYYINLFSLEWHTRGAIKTNKKLKLKDMFEVIDGRMGSVKGF